MLRMGSEVHYEDVLLNMMHMEEAWTKNMADDFNPSWTNVLDKTTMEWHNKFAPGFMCVGRKPHLLGNKHRMIYCGLTLILWRANIVEGKDRLAQMGPMLHSYIGRLVGLMIRIYELLFSMGKYIVMYCGFCVANGIIALVEKVFYAVYLTKKHRYWPKFFQGISSDRIFQTRS